MTDIGSVRSLLDEAASAWPDLAEDRKALLLRLAEHGAAHLPPVSTELDAELERHAGEWAAIHEDRLLVADADPAVVIEWLRAHGERATQMFIVPGAGTEVVTEHGLA